MTDKEKFRAEVERLKNDLIEAPNKSEIDLGRISAFEDMLLYIDSQEEEPVSEDLEKAARESGQKHFPDEYNIWARPNYEAKHAELAFKEGAKWQKRQMMNDAIDVYVCTNLDGTRKILCSTTYGGRMPWNGVLGNCNVGDEVKLIIVKEG